MNIIEFGDCVGIMNKWADEGVKVHTCVTSPPYWGLRDYGIEGQLGLEKTPEEYVSGMVNVFRAVRRILRKDGTVWLNLGDSYATSGQSGWQGKNGQRANRAFTAENLPLKSAAGIKTKDLIGIPWMVAFALRTDGWFLRQDIIWHKPNTMPERVKDRCTKAHEYIFLLSKAQKYYYNQASIMEKVENKGVPRKFRDAKEHNACTKRNDNGRMYFPKENRNKRSVWTVPTTPYRGDHFATFPPKLITPCILAGAPENGIVLDPFMGSGTTAMVALQNNRQYLGCELNPQYKELQGKRLIGARRLF